MTSIKRAYERSEDIACRYLKHRLRDRAREWFAANLNLPVVGTALGGVGWLVGLLLDLLIPVVALTSLSVTVVGLPVALMLLAAFFTARCD